MVPQSPPGATPRLPPCPPMLGVGGRGRWARGCSAGGRARVGVPWVPPARCQHPAGGRCVHVLFLSSASLQNAGPEPPSRFQRLREPRCPAGTPLPSLGSRLGEKQPPGRGDAGWGAQRGPLFPRGRGRLAGRAPAIDPWLGARGGTWEQGEAFNNARRGYGSLIMDAATSLPGHGVSLLAVSAPLAPSGGCGVLLVLQHRLPWWCRAHRGAGGRSRQGQEEARWGFVPCGGLGPRSQQDGGPPSLGFGAGEAHEEDAAWQGSTGPLSLPPPLFPQRFPWPWVLEAPPSERSLGPASFQPWWVGERGRGGDLDLGPHALAH